MPHVLITGANRGLGLEFVHHYAQEGWQVLACCRNPEQAKDLQALQRSFPAIDIKQLDVGDEDHIATLARTLTGVPLDLLINNAGVLTGRPGSSVPDDDDTFFTLNVRDWQNLHAVNVIAPVLITRALLPNLRLAKAAKVAMISSGWGQIGGLSDGDIFLPYKTSKAGLNMAMRAMAAALKPDGIAVFSLRPGWVRTDMGGPEASLSAKDSVAGMTKTLNRLSLNQTGLFFDLDGQQQDW